MKIANCRLGFIGFGHMAQILFQAIDRLKWVPRSQILFLRRDPKKMKEDEQTFGITSTTLKTLVETSNLLLLCVRPAQAGPILSDLARLGMAEKRLISILAGIKISFFEKHLGSQIQISRAMPNLASAVGEGMTLFSYSRASDAEFRHLAKLLFEGMGEVAEIEEKLMDLACGMAGSAPGFVFRLIEAEARLGEKNGMAYPQALKIAAQAFAGAARLVLKGGDPRQLIEKIATPKGTTEAGFRVMKETQIERHFQETIAAAAQRSKELSEEFESS